MIKFTEVPAGLVARMHAVPNDVREASNARGLRIFDARVSDGVIRVTVMPGVDPEIGIPIFTWCIAHKVSFQGGTFRLPTDEEVRDAAEMISEVFPDRPEMQENRLAPAVAGIPARFFVPIHIG
jgi:hypothetical protein